MAWPRRGLPAVLVALAIAGCAGDPASPASPSTEPGTARQAVGDTGAVLFNVGALAVQQRADERAFASILDVDALEAGLYLLADGAPDDQVAHKRDEVYVVLGGRAQLHVQDVDEAIGPGSVVFVRAGVEHRFTDIVGELQIVVIFLNGRPSTTGAGHEAFSIGLDVLESSTNAFDAFLHRSVADMGVYRLPAALGGDEPQVHIRDEINVMLAGTASFAVGDARALPIGPGSVMYVPAGVPHAFVSPASDVVDLILFPADR